MAKSEAFLCLDHMCNFFGPFWGMKHAWDRGKPLNTTKKPWPPSRSGVCGCVCVAHMIVGVELSQKSKIWCETLRATFFVWTVYVMDAMIRLQKWQAEGEGTFGNSSRPVLLSLHSYLAAGISKKYIKKNQWGLFFFNNYCFFLFGIEKINNYWKIPNNQWYYCFLITEPFQSGLKRNQDWQISIPGPSGWKILPLLFRQWNHGVQKRHGLRLTTTLS